EYIALIASDENAVKAVPFNDKATGEQRVRLDVTFDIIDDGGMVKAAIDGREPRIIQGYFLDIAGGMLDMSKGKNVQLNRLSEAVGQNPGVAWTPPMLRGAGPVKLNIVIEQDKQDKEVYRNRIKSIGKPNK